MESETTITAPGTATDDVVLGPDASQDSVITDAESVLDNLLEVVRAQAEEILETARAEANREAAAIRSRSESERLDLLVEARREAADVAKAARADTLAAVESAIVELSAIDDYRSRLAAVAATLRDDATSGPVSDAPTVADAAQPAAETPENATFVEVVFVEVDPESLQMLAGELGITACRDVVDTFLAELLIQLDYLTDAASSQDAEQKKVGRVLHNLSSGCATVGAHDVAELCNEITAEALADHIDELVERGNVVYDEVKRIRDEDLDGVGDDAGAGEDAS